MKKRIKKTVINLVAIIFVVATGYGLVVTAMILKEFKSSPNPEITSDTLIVLGAQVQGKTKETAIPSKSLQERLDKAIQYFTNHPEITIIVSGGQGTDEADSEANVMAKYLIKNGIPEAQIIRENKSTSTLENLKFSNELVPLNNAVVVTNDYHMSRTKSIAKRLGFHLEGSSATTDNSSKYHSYLREILAMGYHLLFVWK
ncbi:uncharacterized SAM-binding protein YcdF (DUF218 family) [Enterococcus sp. PF1-24]|uniref:YdcF family protein n=1 Tax=unclassified Enterococcus TaxID=2608891 RepID=UPI0024753227|nr:MULTISPECIES: YdcF family protein [unclassified Enterococcus]MDH6365185.1 uncharacterized SAM-binding protein YcdF (DUF218 family) [Enterococcus sp. PFB1-1]MDH6402286.1 uncharacterized SAM-binding protein YcdF (DUF218 family) [Enterococcus sp. PF1-24]